MAFDTEMLTQRGMLYFSNMHLSKVVVEYPFTDFKMFNLIIE